MLLLAADRPYRTWVQAFADAGVDTDRVFVLDVVSALDGGTPPQRPDNALFLASPTMLERMAMRIEQLAQKLGQGSHVVVDSLSTLALYNGVPPVQEFSHYLANRLRTQGFSGDFIIRDNQVGASLRERISAFADDHIKLDDPGDTP